MDTATMNRDELRAYAKEHKIAGYTKLKADELRAVVQRHATQDHVGFPGRDGEREEATNSVEPPSATTVRATDPESPSTSPRAPLLAARQKILQAVNRHKIQRNSTLPHVRVPTEDGEDELLPIRQTRPVGSRHINEAVNIARRFGLVDGETLRRAGFNA